MNQRTRRLRSLFAQSELARGILAREIVAKNKEILALQEQIARLQEAATTDPLTGLANRRAFETNFKHELGALARNIPPHPKETGERRHLPVVSLLGIDVDYFKQVNDTHGHPAGDAVLVQLAGLIHKLLGRRESDIIARFGGEEFCVALPNDSAEAAFDQAEAFRLSVSKTLFQVIDKEGRAIEIAVTVSCGIATCEVDEHTLASVIFDQLNAAADRALYWAKEHGRNQVVHYDQLLKV